MLHALSSMQLVALLRAGTIWLSVPCEVAEMLDQCCTGQVRQAKGGCHACMQNTSVWLRMGEWGGGVHVVPSWASRCRP